MKPMHCLIVEDEPLAAGILEDYIQQVPFLQLVGKCPDALFAAEALQQNPVEVLFLDLNLPGLKGLDFLRTLRQPPQVILTTAYHEFALESYDLKVIDYLLKPIDFERFIKAVHKLKPVLEPAIQLTATRPFHFFNVSKKMVRVWIDDILMVESQKEYVRLHLAGGKQLATKMTLGELELILHPHHFIRIHRSFLVSLRHIEAYNNTSVQVEGVEVSLGRQYRDAVLERLNQI